MTRRRKPVPAPAPPTPVARGRIGVRRTVAGEAVYVDGRRYWDGPPMRSAAVVRALVGDGHYAGVTPQEAD